MTVIHRAVVNGKVVWEDEADTYQGLGHFPGEYIRPQEGAVVLEVGAPHPDTGVFSFEVIGVQTPTSDEEIERLVVQRAADLGVDPEVIRSQVIWNPKKEG